MPTPTAARPSARRRPLRRSFALAVLPLAGMAAACGSAQATRPEPAPPTSPTVSVAAAPVASAEPGTSVARPVTDTEVFAAPGAAGPSMVLPARNEFGSSLALVVVDDTTPGWLRVSLPVRPNGTTGWIRAEGVERRQVTLAVHVDLAARRLVVSDAGTSVLETPVAVGAAATPTPTGTFFVVDKLDTGRADGPYGPYAFGLSAHSDVLTEFAGGDGQVGIHGTADPGSIGNAVSNGCIRVPNDVAVALEAMLPLGTPVTVA